MKRLPRGAVAWLVVSAVLALLHAGAGHWLAEHDPIAGLTRKIEPMTVVAALVLMTCRLLLYFVVPGWLLYLIVDQLLGWRSRNPDSGTGTGTGTGTE